MAAADVVGELKRATGDATALTVAMCRVRRALYGNDARPWWWGCRTCPDVDADLWLKLRGTVVLIVVILHNTGVLWAHDVISTVYGVDEFRGNELPKLAKLPFIKPEI